MTATLPRPAGRREAAPARSRVAVLGAGGYTGQEFLRLAREHPRLEVVALMSRPESEPPALVGAAAGAASIPALPPAALTELFAGESSSCDALVACLPHGAWTELAGQHPELASRPARIVDLSSDNRFAEGWVYGLPEAFRESIASARRVANPGCYATALALGLIPAAEEGWLQGPVTASALSGASGAGRGALPRHSFVEAEGGAWLYRAGTEHPHVAEVSRLLAAVSGHAPPLALAPQVVPMARGILAVCWAPLATAVSPEAARARYLDRYAAETFVQVLPEGAWPETRLVRHSNRCDIAVTTMHGGRTLLVAAALDNLMKGAAGQAIQNLNRMHGWPETLGLTANGVPW